MTKKSVFNKTYVGEESTIDLDGDVFEAMTEGNNPILKELPRDSDGYITGKFRVSIIWCSPDDCDCTGFQHRYDCPHHVTCY